MTTTKQQEGIRRTLCEEYNSLVYLCNGDIEARVCFNHNTSTIMVVKSDELKKRPDLQAKLIAWLCTGKTEILEPFMKEEF